MKNTHLCAERSRARKPRERHSRFVGDICKAGAAAAVRAPASSRLRAAGTRRCVPSDEPASPDAAGSAMVMEQLRGSAHNRAWTDAEMARVLRWLNAAMTAPQVGRADLMPEATARAFSSPPLLFHGWVQET